MKALIQMLTRLGRGSLFLVKILAGIPQLFLRFRLVVQQLHSVGVQTLMITLVAGLFVGMVLALQAYLVLVDFGAEESISLMVSLSILRELGPVFTGLLFAGRAGSALTAEIGLITYTLLISNLGPSLAQQCFPCETCCEFRGGLVAAQEIAHQAAARACELPRTLLGQIRDGR